MDCRQDDIQSQYQSMWYLLIKSIVQGETSNISASGCWSVRSVARAADWNMAGQGMHGFCELL